MTDEEKIKFELLKFRVEEFKEGFYNLRNLEWLLLFQTFSAFIICGTVFYNLIDTYDSIFLRISFIAITIIIQCLAIYLLTRIQERMKLSRDCQNAYTDKLYLMLSMERDAVEIKGINELKGKYKWASLPQKTLLWLVAIALIIYFMFVNSSNNPTDLGHRKNHQIIGIKEINNGYMISNEREYALF